MSVDVNVDYGKIQKSVESYQVYKDLQLQYKKVSKKAGSIYESVSSAISTPLEKLSGTTKSYQKKVKSQFEHLLDLNNTIGKNSTSYLKKKFIEALTTLEPQILEILSEEILKAIGCDQQQTYVADVPVYVKVGSIDLGKLLVINPNDKTGKLLYEKTDLSIQSKPFAMNKELYALTQTSNSYFNENSTYYNGVSKQNLFDIKYLETHPLTGIGGGWYEVIPKARIANINLTDTNQNLVGQFVQDYLRTIRIFDNHNVIAWTLNFMTGALSIKLNSSDEQIKSWTWLSKMTRRILGLCFDNNKEIDVSGTAKISQSDGIDQTFYELSDIDLREIEENVINVKAGVFVFEDCETVKLKVNADSVVDYVEKIIKVDDKDFVNQATKAVATTVTDDEDIKKLPGIDIFDTNFIKQILNGLIYSILSPKILLPIYVMINSIEKKYENSLSQISSYEMFFKYFKEFSITFVSRIFGLFIKILFNIIKRDIKNLVISIIKDIKIEKKLKDNIMILKLIKTFLIVAEVYKLITDWRKCKSVVDELLRIIQLSMIKSKNIVPWGILAASSLLEGYSETRAFIGTIEELQKLGIPTGAMPDGSPNLTVLSMFSQLKAQALEKAENGKVQVAVGPLTITPAGVTVPSNAFGKDM